MDGALRHIVLFTDGWDPNEANLVPLARQIADAGITLSVLVFLTLSGDYIAPYGTPIGQVLLGAYLAMYVGMLLWLRKMAQGKPMPRFIGTSVRERAA